MSQLAPRKRKTAVTHNRHAVREPDGSLRVSAEMKATRAKEPIFGPAVPEGEEFEYTTLACNTQEEVRDEIAGIMYDVLNGLVPQQKGEFVLRGLAQMAKSISMEQGTQHAAGVAAELAELLSNDDLPSLDDLKELQQFKDMARESERKT